MARRLSTLSRAAPSRFARSVAAIGAGAVMSTPTMGANWFAEAGLSTRATYTSNANFQIDTQRESDVIVDLAPSFVVRGEGRRLRLSATAALSGVTYVNGSQTSGLTPTGTINASVEAIERWFFVDANVTTTQSLENPFAPRPEGPSTFNQLTTNQARVSPYIERQFPNDIRLLLRSDNTWTQTRGAPEGADESFSARHAARIEQAPRPFGWAIEADRSETDFDGTTTPAPDIDTARVRLRYTIGGQWVLGARYGVERSDLLVDTGERRTFAGAELAWQPSERTRFDGFWEDRSFGAGWQASFSHRMPRLAWSVSSNRDLTSSAAPLFTLPATGDVAGLLDAAFQTRVPDPIERARVVEDFIARRGLPRTLAGPSVLFSDRIVLRTALRGAVTWIGSRSTIALNGFTQRDEIPTGEEFVLLPGAQPGDIAQRGAGLAVSHRLSFVSTMSGGVSWARTRELSSATEARSRQLTYRIEYERQFGPKTSVIGGARHQVFDSDVVNDSRETGIFVGLGHRF